MRLIRNDFWLVFRKQYYAIVKVGFLWPYNGLSRGRVKFQVADSLFNIILCGDHEQDIQNAIIPRKRTELSFDYLLQYIRFTFHTKFTRYQFNRYPSNTAGRIEELYPK